MMFPCRLVRLLAAFAWVAAVGAVGLLAEDKAGGLVVTFVNGAARDVAVRENVQLFVPQGEAPTPFLPAGPFTATWTGFLTSELRAEYVFHAEFNGDLKVTFGDASALATHSADGKLVAGSKVKLNKGPNALKVEYKAPEKGEAFVRLFWSNKEVPITPIPLAVLGHDASLELEKSSQIHQGRDLFAYCAVENVMEWRAGGWQNLRRTRLRWPGWVVGEISIGWPAGSSTPARCARARPCLRFSPANTSGRMRRRWRRTSVH